MDERVVVVLLLVLSLFQLTMGQDISAELQKIADSVQVSHSDLVNAEAAADQLANAADELERKAVLLQILSSSYKQRAEQDLEQMVQLEQAAEAALLDEKRKDDLTHELDNLMKMSLMLGDQQESLEPVMQQDEGNQMMKKVAEAMQSVYQEPESESVRKYAVKRSASDDPIDRYIEKLLLDAALEREVSP
ncbi:hypothetical protein Ciccas_012371 [Cichlidogyrus casuarinus]|uniref:Uncharacterized protein n=1 Tax=Cichlidogyrus casuarinus TaxID=1844966 RepID=A0ABD2PRL1_9PLAT